MTKHTTVFASMLRHLSRSEFEGAVSGYNGDFKIRTLSCWDLFRKSGLIPRSSAPAVINQNLERNGIKPDGKINFLSNEPPFQYNVPLKIPQSSALRRLIFKLFQRKGN